MKLKSYSTLKVKCYFLATNIEKKKECKSVECFWLIKLIVPPQTQAKHLNMLYLSLITVLKYYNVLQLLILFKKY